MQQIITLDIMGEKIEVLKPSVADIKKNLCMALTASIFIYSLHIFDQIKLVGSMYTLYIPFVIITMEFIKNLSKTFSIEQKSKKQQWKPLRAAFKVIMGTLGSVLLFMMVLILLGAPVLSQHEETFLCAFSLTATSFINLVINEGFEKAVDTSANELTPSKIVSLASLFGCWASSVVIPLDWDRWWQKWPIPCLVGTLLGYNLGYIVLILLSYPNSIKSSKKKNIRKRV